MSEEQVGHSILGSVSMHQNWKGESDEVHENHLWRRGLRLWRRRHGGQLQVEEADILNEPNFDNNQQTFLLSPLYLHPSTPSPGLLALLAAVLSESPAKKELFYTEVQNKALSRKKAVSSYKPWDI